MKTTEEILDMMRHHDTPRTDAVLNTFDGNQSKLAADLATHAEELERELEQSRQDRIAGAECSKRLAAKLAKLSPPKRCGWRGMGGGEGCVLPLGHSGSHVFSDGSGSHHNEQRDGRDGDVDGDLQRLRSAVRNLRDVQGRHHTQIATERLFALLPENDKDLARLPQPTPTP